MKKIFLLLLLFLPFLGVQSQALQSENLLNADSTPKEALCKILALLAISHQNDLGSIVEKTQCQWRQVGKERWELAPIYEDKKDLLLPLFKEIGMIDGSFASKKTYDYVLVFGGLYLRVQKRIGHLIDSYNKGVRFKKVVFLTGQRDLNLTTSEQLSPLSSETEMMQFVWENIEMPIELRTIPIQIIDAPKKVQTDGTLQRPDTKDTLIGWLKTNPLPGKCLFISNQPFCGYQDSVVKTYLPSTFETETIGYLAEEGMPIAVYLDNLARWLYQERLRKEVNHGISP